MAKISTQAIRKGVPRCIIGENEPPIAVYTRKTGIAMAMSLRTHVLMLTNMLDVLHILCSDDSRSFQHYLWCFTIFGEPPNLSTAFKFLNFLFKRRQVHSHTVAPETTAEFQCLKYFFLCCPVLNRPTHMGPDSLFIKGNGIHSHAY